jgi:hypothetical protein
VQAHLQHAKHIPCANPLALPALYCVTLCSVCLRHLAFLQYVFRSLGMFTCRRGCPARPPQHLKKQKIERNSAEGPRRGAARPGAPAGWGERPPAPSPSPPPPP